ncbi:NUDIX domain-containing protein [Streptomyces cyaneofuscatus]|uniref:NUDIX domain-containing protein n=1 Tax=Streptomyces cyaneofuscatus TaxID=66883 RepID=UPI003648FAF4
MVLDRYRQSWELPGGSIEEDETPRQAAARAAGGGRAPVRRTVTVHRLRAVRPGARPANGVPRAVRGILRRDPGLRTHRGDLGNPLVEPPRRPPGVCTAPGRLPRRAHPVTRQRRHDPAR